jgi:NCAIR mutase (PurE)-related protein
MTRPASGGRGRSGPAGHASHPANSAPAEASTGSGSALTERALRDLLEAVRAGSTTIEAALARLRHLPFEDLGFATLDHHRELRCGFPEVIYGAGKSASQVLAIARGIVDRGQALLATRLDEDAASALREAFPDGRHSPVARTFHRGGADAPPSAGRVTVVSAGTSDLAVAEEAAETAGALGASLTRVHDVGVAGLHRLLASLDRLREADAIVVAAGMEGALPSVVGGLTDVPIVAVPTSVGYGASFGGISALLAMLNSCAAGVVVVNIDNGFGAGYAAARIARRGRRGGTAG